MANANRGLGRGLGALLGDAALQTESADSLYLPFRRWRAAPVSRASILTTLRSPI
ncbi:MAG: hypothetical protein ACLSHJ_07870 [Oscillospiraceae bacterium]